MHGAAENVGGETLEAVLDAANTLSRIVACGMVSQVSLGAAGRGCGHARTHARTHASMQARSTQGLAHACTHALYQAN